MKIKTDKQELIAQKFVEEIYNSYEAAFSFKKKYIENGLIIGDDSYYGSKIVHIYMPDEINGSSCKFQQLTQKEIKKVSFGNFKILVKTYKGNFSDIRTSNDFTLLHLVAFKCNDVGFIRCLLLKSTDGVNAKDVLGETPLALAIKGNRYCNIEKLLDAGADIFAKNSLGFNILDIALKKIKDTDSSKKESIKFLPLLINNHILKSSSEKIPTIIKMALKFPKAACVDIFSAIIENYGPDIHLPNFPNKPYLLHLVAERNYIGIVKLILQKGGDASPLDEVGKAPINYSTSHTIIILLSEKQEIYFSKIDLYESEAETMDDEDTDNELANNCYDPEIELSGDSL